MKLCVYVMTVDTGFAPNPYFGFCTLAACTPNRQNAKLQKGDWLMGHSTSDRGRQLIYAMELAEVTDFDDYFADRRFAQKIPRFDQNWQQACGDNIYHRNEAGEWEQSPTLFHDTPEFLAKDTKNAVVYIGKRFFYFGENAPAVPSEFSDLLQDRQGIKYGKPAELVQRFIDWLCRNYSPGIHGNPRDLHLWFQGGEVAVPPRCSPAEHKVEQGCR